MIQVLENRTLLSWVIPEQSTVPEHLYEGSQVQFTQTIGISGWDYANISIDGGESFPWMPTEDYPWSV